MSRCVGGFKQLLALRDEPLLDQQDCRVMTWRSYRMTKRMFLYIEYFPTGTVFRGRPYKTVPDLELHDMLEPIQ